MAIMAMPKAAIDLDYCLVFGKNQVWFSGQAFLMKTVAEPTPVKLGSYDELWLCVLPLDVGHHS